jgi:hypothetical protein
MVAGGRVLFCVVSSKDKRFWGREREAYFVMVELLRMMFVTVVGAAVKVFWFCCQFLSASMGGGEILQSD